MIKSATTILIYAMIAIFIITIAARSSTNEYSMRKVAYSSVSSCYGPGLYGNRMANGRKLTRRTVGIAHRTLRLGTKVRVTYRGRSRTTLVKDRGPYSGNRTSDLTERLVRILKVSSCRSWGVRTVKLQVVKRR